MAKRSRTVERRKARERERQRNRIIAAVAVLIVIVILAGLALIVTNQPAEAPLPEGLAERYTDIETSLSEEGYPILGNEDAPVQVSEFSSFSCPGCGVFHENVFDSVLERVRSGEVAFTYIPLQTGSVANAQGAARAALCAGEQGQFWQMHDVLFDWQSRFANTAFTGNRLAAGAEALGLDVDQWNTCFGSQRISDTLEAAQFEGVQTTPTITVNGSSVPAELEPVMLAIDEALEFAGGRSEPDDVPEATAEAPAEEIEDAPEQATDESDDAEATDEPDDTEVTDEAPEDATEESGDAESSETTDEVDAEQTPELEETNEPAEDATEEAGE